MTPRKPSPLPLIRWVHGTDAPVVDGVEYALLAYLAVRADPDGASIFPTVPQIIAATRLSESAVRTRLRALTDRGVLRETPADQIPPSYHRTLPGRRGVCREIAVPDSLWTAEELEAVNAWRAALPVPRPPISGPGGFLPAPERRPRADAGKAAPHRGRKKTRGVSQTPPPGETPDGPRGVSQTPQGCFTNTPRGVSQTPNLVSTPGHDLAPPTPHADTAPDPVPSDPDVGGGSITPPGDDTGAGAPAVPRDQAEPAVPDPVPSGPDESPTTQESGRERLEHVQRMERADAILSRAVQVWGRAVARPLTAPERRVLHERVARQLERGGDPDTIHAVLTDITGLRDPIRGVLSKTNDSAEGRQEWGVRADDRPDTVLRPVRPHCGDAACRRGYRGVDSEGRPIPCRVQVTDPVTGETHTCHPKATAVPVEDIPKAGLSEDASSFLSAMRATLAQTAKAADAESRTRRRTVRRAPASTW